MKADYTTRHAKFRYRGLPKTTFSGCGVLPARRGPLSLYFGYPLTGFGHAGVQRSVLVWPYQAQPSYLYQLWSRPVVSLQMLFSGYAFNLVIRCDSALCRLLPRLSSLIMYKKKRPRPVPVSCIMYPVSSQPQEFGEFIDKALLYYVSCFRPIKNGK